jgi:hypothetical protein
MAVRLYPALAENGSTLNVAFREIYQDRLNRNPRSLQDVDWPLDVARDAARMVGVLPVGETPEKKEEPKPNALDRGAYNQSRSVIPPRPVTVDQYGRRVYP